MQWTVGTSVIYFPYITLLIRGEHELVPPTIENTREQTDPLN